MASTPDTAETREAARRVLDDCRTADDEPPAPRDSSLARKSDGLEELLPLLAGRDGASHVLDHAGAFVLAVDDPDAVAQELAAGADLLRLDYGKARTQGRVVPDPIRLAGDPGAVADYVAARTLLALAPSVPAGEVVALGAESVVSFEDRLPEAPKEIARARRDGLAVVLAAPSKGEREHLERLLSEYDVDHAGAATSPLAPGSCRIVDGGPASGFAFRGAGLLLLTATDLFGAPRSWAPRRKAASEAFLSTSATSGPATWSSTATTASESSQAS